MLLQFEGKGHCVTCGSAYMGDIMGQISCNEWKINMVGTIQSSCTGADIAATCNGIAVHIHESCVWQHYTLPLCVAAWADNAVVKTMSNFHSAVVIEYVLLQQGMDNDGNREKDQV